MADLTTAERLFKVRYIVVIPTYAKDMKLTELSQYRPTSNDSKFAEIEETYPCHVNYPVSKLATLSDHGVEIKLTKPKDALTMYNDIKAHLRAWSKAVAEDVHQLNVPVESLETLNRFAGVLYPIARQWMATDIKEDKFSNAFTDFVRKRTGHKDDKTARVANLPTESSTDAVMEDLATAASRRVRRQRNLTRSGG